MECSNCRAITLLNVTYKVLSGILCNRLTKYAKEILGDYQCGYRVNRSTTDHILTIRQTQEKAYEYNIHLHNLFIDFNPLNPELNPICYFLALLAHHFLHVSRIRVKSLTIRLLMSYIYMERLFLMFLDHTQRRSTVGRTPLDE